MIWVLGWICLGVALAIACIVWQRWIAPWSRIEQVATQINQGGKPSTFVVAAGARPQRVAFALEKLYDQHRQLAQQASERASGTQTILAAMHDGLLAVDAGHRITLCNDTFRDLFHLRDNCLGEPLLDIVRGVDLDQLIATTLRTKVPQQGELTVPDLQTGGVRQLQLSAVPMKTDGQIAAGAVVLFHDITQLKKADEIRRDFVANVSHELRTPLSILRGYIETLLEDAEVSPEELARILEVMKRHSDRLGALVDDLLSLAQLESIHPNLRLSDVRISELFAAIVRDWGKKFGEKKLSIDVAIAPSLPVVQADETRLQEVLYNLLDNALKYSRPGGKIRLQADRRDDHMVLSVSDTGVGISEADLPRIFERFYRADKARSRELGGTGLGLSIVKHIAQMHGGQVEAESELGKGTTIRVIIPLGSVSAKN